MISRLIFCLVVVLISSCALRHHEKLSGYNESNILEIQFLDHYKYDTLLLYNNDCLVFSKVLNVKGQGYAGYNIKVYKIKSGVLVFELSDDNVMYSAEAQRKTLKLCKQPINLTFLLNGITQNIKIDSIKKPYLGVERSGDHLFIWWSDEEIQWE